VDDRADYGETRFRAIGLLDARIYALVFAEGGGDGIRAISLRKATKREAKEFQESR
jgi:uncharacterized DUF497 family protein